MYREVKRLDLPAIDREIAEFWKKEQVFKLSIGQRPADRSFVFYEGPPSANGKPGIHHVMARTIKDLFCRYNTLKGYRVERKGGWDTHGLPIELQVERELGITKEDIGRKISVEDYNQACRDTVMCYKDLWDDITRRMGYWVNLDDPYITFENGYIETCWFLLKKLFYKNTPDGEPLLYKGFTIQPFSPAAGTGLSSHELNMPGTYKDVTDVTVVAMFRVRRDALSEKFFDHPDEDLRILAWTTTPWTLPSNVALTVGPDIHYVKVRTLSPYTGAPISVLLAQDRLGAYFHPDGAEAAFEDFKPGDKITPYRIERAIVGRDLIGLRFEQLLPSPDLITPELAEKGFRVIGGDFVTTEDGTGVVHTAPYFGADDFRVCKEAGIPYIGLPNDQNPDLPLPLVDRQGRFVAEVPIFGGRYVKEEYYSAEERSAPGFKPTDLLIALHLKEQNLAFRVEKYKHPYPHCWRTDKPVLYYPLDSWFIRVSAARQRMQELNRTINWKPASTGEGRFGKWLENLQDWNLSRSRYWGVPLPIWRTEDGSEALCVGSVSELRERVAHANATLGLSQTVPDDLHRPFIDEIVLAAPSGRPMQREPDLIDVWFDSGAMPYAQWGLDPDKLAAGDERPFKAPFAQSYPADFIAEGVDQTRGWFYTLHAIAALCFDSIAYRNVVSNGLVLDKNGEKMSKSKGNIVDPFETIAMHGADATRWYMISNANPWDNLKFDPNGIVEVRNKFFGTLYNTYAFFALYANLDDFVGNQKADTPLQERSQLDRWILSKLNNLVRGYRGAMDDYEPTRAARLIENFVDEHLSNWYVRLSRRRFWRGEITADKQAAYQTLHECLLVCAQLSSSLAPFFSDWLYRNLVEPQRKAGASLPISVHLSDLPEANTDCIDPALEQRIEYAQRICSLALSIRKRDKLRVRQPLQKILLPVLDERFIADVESVKDLILSETNVKTLEYVTDESGMLRKSAKANFKTLGARLGKDMKTIAAMIAAFSHHEIVQLEKNGSAQITIDGSVYTLTPEDLIISTEDLPGWKSAAENGLTVALDVSLTPELEAEGVARDLVNRIQHLRKEKDFNVTDRIRVLLQDHPAIRPAVALFGDYISAEVLADELRMADQIANGDVLELDEETGIAAKIERI